MSVIQNTDFIIISEVSEFFYNYQILEKIIHKSKFTYYKM